MRDRSQHEPDARPLGLLIATCFRSCGCLPARSACAASSGEALFVNVALLMSEAAHAEAKHSVQAVWACACRGLALWATRARTHPISCTGWLATLLFCCSVPVRTDFFCVNQHVELNGMDLIMLFDLQVRLGFASGVWFSLPRVVPLFKAGPSPGSMMAWQHRACCLLPRVTATWSPI